MAAGEQPSCTEVSGIIAEAKTNSTAENDGDADDQDRVGGEDETGDVSNLDTRTDARGRLQPAHKPKKSRFDAEHYAFMIGGRIEGLVDLLDESPERFDAVLDHLRNDPDAIDALAALARNPKVRTIIAVAIEAPAICDTTSAPPCPPTAAFHPSSIGAQSSLP
jgi:hypothetical protein